MSDKELSFSPDIFTSGSIEDFVYQYWLFVNDSSRAKMANLKLYSKMAKWCNKNKEKILGI